MIPIPDMERSANPLPSALSNTDGAESVMAVIISFNGASKLLETVHALRGQVEHIHIIDNASSEPTLTLLNALEALQGVSIRRLAENRGIGAALNLGVAKARADGFDWLLTMDQDSRADPCMLHAFRQCIQADSTRVCLTPTLVVHGTPGSEEEREVAYAITSGNLVNLALFDQIGLYNEDMFIDCVDFDFCLRLRAKGYRIFRAGKARLHHELGDPHQTNRPLARFYTQHSPLRRYYMYRNFLMLLKLHFKQFPAFLLKSSIVHLILLFLIPIYDPNSKLSLLAIAQGIHDSCVGRSGKCTKFY